MEKKRYGLTVDYEQISAAAGVSSKDLHKFLKILSVSLHNGNNPHKPKICLNSSNKNKNSNGNAADAAEVAVSAAPTVTIDHFVSLLAPQDAPQHGVVVKLAQSIFDKLGERRDFGLILASACCHHTSSASAVLVGVCACLVAALHGIVRTDADVCQLLAPLVPSSAPPSLLHSFKNLRAAVVAVLDEVLPRDFVASNKASPFAARLALATMTTTRK